MDSYSAVGGRAVDYRYLRQIAQAADSLGYQGVLIPTGRSCEDPWVVASSLIAATERLRFLVAVRPGLTTPAFAARQTATLDRLSDGRLLINVVTGGDPVELKGDGVFLDHTDRYEVTDEYLTIWRQLLEGGKVNFQGKHLRIEDGTLLYPPVNKPYPPLYFGGSSAIGNEVAGKHVDVYLTKTLDYRALLFPGSRYDAQAMEWLINRGSTVLAVGAEVPGATWTIRYRGDEDPLVRLVTEALIAELVAAEWWSRNV